MEAPIIAGVAHDRSEAKVTVVGVPDRTGMAARIFEAVAAAEINIDMIVQNVSATETGLTDISFTLPKTEGPAAVQALQRIQDEVGFTQIQYDDQIGKLSLVGAGMRSNPGVSATFFSALAAGRGQHRDDLDLGDPDLGRHPRRAARRRRACGAQRVRARLRRGRGRRLRGHRPLTMSPNQPLDPAPSLGIIGATGAVGRVVLSVLPMRRHRWGRLRVAAGTEDVGSIVRIGDEEVTVEAVSAEFFDGIDVAIFDIPPGIAREWVELAAARGVVCIDNSTVFRTEPDVPLVVPEVNPHKVTERPRGIIANPGATVMTMIDVLAVLHGGWELTDLVVTTLQAASGLGRAGHDPAARRDRRSSTATASSAPVPATCAGSSSTSSGPTRPFPAPLVLNLVPFVGHHVGEGWTSEETKVRDETRKILELPNLPVSATCVRVPVVSSHSVTVHATFAQRIKVSEARQALVEAPGVVVLDDPDEPEFPTPNDVVGSDPRFVGRLRQAPEAPTTLDLFVCGDNLRKGAALNMLQTAELVAASL